MKRRTFLKHGLAALTALPFLKLADLLPSMRHCLFRPIDIEKNLENFEPAITPAAIKDQVILRYWSPEKQQWVEIGPVSNVTISTSIEAGHYSLNGQPVGPPGFIADGWNHGCAIFASAADRHVSLTGTIK